MKIRVAGMLFIYLYILGPTQALALAPCPPMLFGATGQNSSSCGAQSEPVDGFYVDPVGGDDANDGLTPPTAWKSLDQVESSLGNNDTSVDVWLEAGRAYPNQTIVIDFSGSTNDLSVFGCFTIEDGQPVSC